MMNLLWILVAVDIVLFAYTVQFTGATLTFGRELAETETGTGFQDAVTPPWQKNIAIVAYGAWIVLSLCIWYASSWWKGLLAFVLTFVAAALVRKLMPNVDGTYFRAKSLGSMLARYANFVRDGDPVRAQLMGELLTKAGMPPPKVRNSQNSDQPLTKS